MQVQLTRSLLIGVASGSASLDVDTGVREFSTDGGVTWNPLAGSVTVPPGGTSFQIRVATLEDSLLEGTETMSVSASTSQNSSPVVGIGTILEGTVVLSISGPSDVNEAAGTITYTVSLSGASEKPISVNYSSNSASALSDIDYSGISGSLTFAPGETSKTITLSIINDAVFEGAESFSVGLSNAVNAAIQNGNVVTTIYDNGAGIGGNDDDRVVVTSVSSPSVTEGGDLIFNVNLSGAGDSNASVIVNASSGSASLVSDTAAREFSVDGGATWSPLTGVVNVPVGSTSFQVRIGTVVDGLIEGSETFTLSAATAQNSSPVNGIGTINDGVGQTISVTGPASVNEAAGTVTYTVSLSSPSGAVVSVNYATNNGTAVAGNDFAATAGSITFAPGETSKTITVPITNDSLVENVESFQLQLK